MEFRHILFPVDFSPRCNGVGPHVRAMAERFSATVTLYHVLETTPIWAGAGDGAFVPYFDMPALQADAEDRLLQFALTILPGITPTRLVEQGEPGGCIAQLAKARGADLIMMPTHGRGVFRTALLGSTTSKVLHDSHAAVWTAAHMEEPVSVHTGWNSILCSIDLLPESIPLLQAAAQLGRKCGAKVTVVHAVPGNDVRPGKYFDQPFETFLKDYAGKEIARLQMEAGTDFPAAPVVLEAGNISKVVRDAALEHKADLIVIGRGVIHEFAGRLRTHAWSIIRDAPCPVLSL